jgi:uncharacterized protein
MLKGRVVGLREQRREDAETLFPLYSDAEHVSLASSRPFRPQTVAARQAEFDKRQAEPDPATAFFTIQRQDDETSAALGDAGLWGIDSHNRSAHVGISLLPSARGQGLGRDAVEVVCRFGFEVLGLERLALETLSVNAPMQATALACGFVEEGRLRSAAWFLGRRVDEVLYGMLVDEWRAHLENSSPARPRRPEEITMVEYPSSTAAGSAQFLTDVFGWTATTYGPQYTDVSGGGIAVGFQADPAGQPAGPLLVIEVADLAEARSRLEAAGGVVTREPFDFPGGSRFHFREPGGNELAVWTPAPDAG